jgi:hypothetical protein
MQTSQAVSTGATFLAGGVENSSAPNVPSPNREAPADFERHMRQSASGLRAPAPGASPATPPAKTSPAGTATKPPTVGKALSAPVPGPTPPRTGVRDAAVVIAGRPVEANNAERVTPTTTTVSREHLHREAAFEPVIESELDVAVPRPATPEKAMTPADASVMPQPVPPPVSIQPLAIEPSPTEGGSALEGDEGAQPRTAAGVISAGDAEAPDATTRRAAAPARTGVETVAPRSEALVRSVAQPVAEPESASPQTALEVDGAGEQHPRLTRALPNPVSEPGRPQRPEPHSEASAMKDPSVVAKGQRARGGESDKLRLIDISRWQRAEVEIPAVTPALLRRASELPFSGTGAAKLERSMDRSAEQNQIAGLREQKLPPVGRSVAGGDLRPLADPALELARSAAVERPDKAQSTAGEALVGSVLHPAAGAASALAGGSGEVAGAGAVRTAEQVLQNLTREVAQFKRYNAESMAVVLKPDAHTEIFLHLVTRNGQIEIQARFERGDFTSLSGQWAQLQQTLSQQGVRLGNLQEGFHQPSSQPPTGGSDWSQGQMQQGGQRHSGRQTGEEARAIPIEEILRTGPAGQAASHRGGRRATSSRATLEAWA